MKAAVIFVAAILIGCVFGAGAMYYYRENEVQDAFSAGMSYQSSITPASTTPASITLALTTGAFNHAATIAADGSVAAEVAVTDTLTITNTDDSRDAAHPILMAYNPVTDKDGLHDNLETDATELGVTIGGLTSKLFHDEEYTDGVTLVDIPAGGEIAVTVTLTFEVAVAGTFQDAQTYTNYLYLYQNAANYCDVVSYTVST
jgi:hypothetical protein